MTQTMMFYESKSKKIISMRSTLPSQCQEEQGEELEIPAISNSVLILDAVISLCSTVRHYYTYINYR